MCDARHTARRSLFEAAAPIQGPWCGGDAYGRIWVTLSPKDSWGSPEKLSQPTYYDCHNRTWEKCVHHSLKAKDKNRMGVPCEFVFLLSGASASFLKAERGQRQTCLPRATLRTVVCPPSTLLPTSPHFSSSTNLFRNIGLRQASGKIRLLQACRRRREIRQALVLAVLLVTGSQLLEA